MIWKYVAAILQLLGGPLYDNFQRIGCLRLSCSIMDKCCSGFHILQTPSRTFTSYLQWKKFNTILSGAFQYGLVKLNAALSRIKIIYTIWMDGGVSFC
jgi:hypothetical protein